MSLDELIEQCQRALEQIAQAMGAAAGVRTGAGELDERFAALGTDDKAAHLGAVQREADAWQGQLRTAADTGRDLINQIQAAKGAG